jgi:hypothetical protein
MNGPVEFLLYATPLTAAEVAHLTQRPAAASQLRVAILDARGPMGRHEIIEGDFDVATLDYIMDSPGAPTAPGLAIWTGNVAVATMLVRLSPKERVSD